MNSSFRIYLRQAICPSCAACIDFVTFVLLIQTGGGQRVNGTA